MSRNKIYLDSVCLLSTYNANSYMFSEPNPPKEGMRHSFRSSSTRYLNPITLPPFVSHRTREPEPVRTSSAGFPFSTLCLLLLPHCRRLLITTLLQSTCDVCLSAHLPSSTSASCITMLHPSMLCSVLIALSSLQLSALLSSKANARLIYHRMEV